MSADRLKVRAVFDCMVFVQGVARGESPAGACLQLVELAAIQLCISEEILSEIQGVLTRPRIQRKFPALTDELVGRFVTALLKQAVPIPEVPRHFIYERDPKDEPYLNLAIAAGASYLVSRDADILDLANPTNPDSIRLRRYAPDLRIRDPVSFLRELRRTVELSSEK